MPGNHPRPTTPESRAPGLERRRHSRPRPAARRDAACMARNLVPSAMSPTRLEFFQKRQRVIAEIPGWRPITPGAAAHDFLMQSDLTLEQRALGAHLEWSNSFMKAPVRADLMSVLHDGLKRCRKCLHRMCGRKPGGPNLVLPEKLEKPRRTNFSPKLPT